MFVCFTLNFSFSKNKTYPLQHPQEGVVSTIIIYAINFVAGFAGADYSFTNGEVFVMWILMAILVNNCFKK